MKDNKRLILFNKLAIKAIRQNIDNGLYDFDKYIMIDEWLNLCNKSYRDEFTQHLEYQVYLRCIEYGVEVRIRIKENGMTERLYPNYVIDTYMQYQGEEAFSHLEVTH